ncbi:MAG: hypothetical protein C0433_19875 [Cyclobacterium sp.]|nr:hypothetical protein [Cyclobacterium sp.]
MDQIHIQCGKSLSLLNDEKCYVVFYVEFLGINAQIRGMNELSTKFSFEKIRQKKTSWFHTKSFFWFL